MSLADDSLVKTPFPWFGGSSAAAPHVWAALGDPDHYVEPFGGSLAVLLRRPHLANRAYHSETVNDLDGLLVNAWRGIQLAPEATAAAASWPVSEADMHARHLALVRFASEHDIERLMADPAWCDPVAAGWWIWGQSCWIGGGWCSGEGPWIVGDDGRITRRAKEAREPGVARKLPHVSDDGRGVNHAGAREPGVARKLPHVSNDGRGVNHAGAREPGVAHDEHDYHPMAMPEICRWFAFLSARLRHVRILNGGWERAVTRGASHSLVVRQGGVCGYLLDPPYAASADRAGNIYACEDLAVAHDVAAWALANGADPHNRIALKCFEGEHDAAAFLAAGWRIQEWYEDGYLTGGYSQRGVDQQHRERLYLSPHCVAPVATRPRQTELFGAAP